jgi:murein DD-endopeptidase MepM/ murein hydrolase activator NlpD
MIRYAHLSGIPPNITVGTTVDPGATIGFVGNSGTSAEAAGTAEGLHLHSDILVYGQNVWLPFEPQTLREMMARILGDTTETTTP